MVLYLGVTTDHLVWSSGDFFLLITLFYLQVYEKLAEILTRWGTCVENELTFIHALSYWPLYWYWIINASDLSTDLNRTTVLVHVVVITHYIGILNSKLVAESFRTSKLHRHAAWKANKVGGNKDRVKFIICFYFRDASHPDGAWRHLFI